MVDRAFIGQLEEVWSSIATLGHELGADDWSKPTDCPGWTVKDQLSHVIGTESMLAGRSAPPAVPDDPPHVHNPIGKMNEAWIEARRSTPGPEVLAEFEALAKERLESMRAMSDEDLEREGPSPIGNVPYATFMQVRVMDCWVHEQDMRRAVGRPGHLSGSVAELAIDRLASGLGFVVGKRVAPPDGTTVVVRLRDPLARTLAVEVRDGRARPVDPPASPTVTIDTDGETFACLVGGRWTGERALDEGRVQISGDEAMGRSLVTQLTTMP